MKRLTFKKLIFIFLYLTALPLYGSSFRWFNRMKQKINHYTQTIRSDFSRQFQKTNFIKNKVKNSWDSWKKSITGTSLLTKKSIVSIIGITSFGWLKSVIKNDQSSSTTILSSDEAYEKMSLEEQLFYELEFYKNNGTDKKVFDIVQAIMKALIEKYESFGFFDKLFLEKFEKILNNSHIAKVLDILISTIIKNANRTNEYKFLYCTLEIFHDQNKKNFYFDHIKFTTVIPFLEYECMHCYEKSIKMSYKQRFCYLKIIEILIGNVDENNNYEIIKYSSQEKKMLQKLIEKSLLNMKKVAVEDFFTIIPFIPNYFLKFLMKNKDKKYTELIAKQIYYIPYLDLDSINKYIDAKNRCAEEEKMGNYVLYHGQPWTFHFTADIYKRLWSIVYQEQVRNDFLFTRYDERVQCNDQVKDVLWLSAPLPGGACGKSLIFMGLGRKDDFNFVMDILRNSFLQYDLQDIFEKYFSDIQALKKLHTAASPKEQGHLLLISISPKHIGQIKRVIPGNNYKGGDELFTQTIDGITINKTSDLLSMIRDLNSPLDEETRYESEFTIPITTEYMLDPKKGPKIWSYHSADPEKFRQYEQARDHLMHKIGDEIRKKQNRNLYEQDIHPAYIVS